MPGDSSICTRRPAFAGLEGLTLHLSSNPAQQHAQGYGPETILPSFLLGMPNLKHLSITLPPFYRSTRTNGVGQELRSTYGDADFRKFSALTFPHLETCRLVNLSLRTSPGDMSVFLAKHATTLQTLALVNLGLPAPAWLPLIALLGEKLKLKSFELGYTWSKELLALIPAIEEEFEVPREVMSKAAESVLWASDGLGKRRRSSM
ncbi:hypothetical protein LTR85_004851 [Meristemomyces frigidus]|nr:hypothetical protein LTR85_004851 [Meristemomyces frigidus]